MKFVYCYENPEMTVFSCASNLFKIYSDALLTFVLTVHESYGMKLYKLNSVSAAYFCDFFKIGWSRG
jgi:hypothetical protein